MTVAEARSLLESELPTVDALVESVCRRYGLRGDDADSFASEVRFRLVDQDYAILRKFSGRSSLKSYLSIVISNIYRDCRIKATGKWRPCAEARRHGTVGTRLDAFLNRDGLPLDDAVRHVARSDDVDMGEAEVRKIAVRIPRRPRRSFQPLDQGPPLEADGSPEIKLRLKEAEKEWRCVLQALQEVMGVLSDQDRLLLSLKFHEELSVATIARTLKVDQRPLYRRLRKCYRQLRTRLEDAGIDRERIAEIIDSRIADLVDGSIRERAKS